MMIHYDSHYKTFFTIVESSIETDFSGTTFTCAVIRDNKVILANVGDSRTSLGYRNENGGISAVNLTIDHKPDLPPEKVLNYLRIIMKIKILLSKCRRESKLRVEEFSLLNTTTALMDPPEFGWVTWMSLAWL